MSSTRKPRSKLLRKAAAGSLVAALTPIFAGCSGYTSKWAYKRPAEPAMNPTETDEAMAHRQWAKEEALYANSGIKAFANRFRFNYETSRNENQYIGVITSPAAFIIESLVFPFTFLRAAPGATETYRPLTVDPSFTASPARAPQESVTGDSSASPASATPVTPSGEQSPATPTPGVGVPDAPQSPRAPAPSTPSPAIPPSAAPSVSPSNPAPAPGAPASPAPPGAEPAPGPPPVIQPPPAGNK